MDTGLTNFWYRKVNPNGPKDTKEDEKKLEGPQPFDWYVDGWELSSDKKTMKPKGWDSGDSKSSH